MPSRTPPALVHSQDPHHAVPGAGEADLGGGAPHWPEQDHATEGWPPETGSRCRAGERRSAYGILVWGVGAALCLWETGAGWASSALRAHVLGEWCLALWTRRGGWENGRQQVKEENGQNLSCIIYPDAILGFEVVLVL